MKRKHKLYSRPKKPFDKKRIEEEAELKKEFGLKNKKEIWKAEAKVSLIRKKAKSLISSDDKEQKSLLEKLNKLGLKVDSISDILGLNKTDYLNRRLQTILLKKNLANTSRHARQLIVHKKVLVDGKVVSVPSYIISQDLENKISLKSKEKK